MSNYYEYINGQRYDASLIRNARFRTRNQGDGRISREDAQTLWQIAMDGGRITEVEANTLRYLIGELNWTEPAQNWMEAELSKEVEKLSSYYKIIDGLKYDRRILNKAEELTRGRGDGRISLEDAKFLLPLFGDAGDVRIEEERTLKYLKENYSWTDAAIAWFQPRFDAISKESDVFGQINGILKFEFQLQQLQLGINRNELTEQTLASDNAVSFPDAFRKALNNLFNHYEGQSFKRILGNIFGLNPQVNNWETLLKEKQEEWLQGGRLALLPGSIASEPSLEHFPTPMNGENTIDNWIFGLELFDLSDDIYWVIVPRDRISPAYNYVGGPNFEEEWPRP